MYCYSSGLILRRTDVIHVVVFGYDHTIAFNSYRNAWSGWDILAKNSDLVTGSAQSGDLTPNTDQNILVAFGKIFSSPPKVFCNCAGHGSSIFANAENVSVTGCRIQFRNLATKSLSTTVQWFAIGL